MSIHSKSNRDKRKKIAARQRNQRAAFFQHEHGIYPLVFKGYLMVPLDTSLTPEQISDRSTYHEDWAIMRHRIFKNARRYRVTAHLFRRGVLGEAVATTYIAHKIKEPDIIPCAQAAFNEAQDDFKDIDMAQVYVCIRA